MEIQKEERQKALNTAITNIEKAYGKGAVMILGESTTMNVESIPTGSITLDMALGIGGVPRGRIVEIYGPESSGKTMISESIVAQVQKMGGTAAFVDVEHALDPSYAAQLGVDIDSLLISQPDTGEEAMEIAEALIRSGAIDVIVIDSVAALVPREEIEGNIGDSHIGLQARLMSQALRKITAAVSKSNCVCIFINQLREKIGVMYGNPEVTTGGRALKFYSSIRLDVRKVEMLKNGSEIIGHKIKIKVVKNKVSPPFKEAKFDLIYSQGIDRIGEIIDIGLEKNILSRAGAYYYYEDTTLGQGREKAKEYFKNNPDFLKKIEDEIMGKAEAGDMKKG